MRHAGRAGGDRDDRRLVRHVSTSCACCAAGRRADSRSHVGDVLGFQHAGAGLGIGQEGGGVRQRLFDGRDMHALADETLESGAGHRRRRDDHQFGGGELGIAQHEFTLELRAHVDEGLPVATTGGLLQAARRQEAGRHAARAGGNDDDIHGRGSPAVATSALANVSMLVCCWRVSSSGAAGLPGPGWVTASAESAVA